MPRALEEALAAAREAWPRLLARLAELVRIPSCSFPGWDPAAVAASAEATAAWLADAGFPEVRVVAGGGPHPAVLACDRRAGPGRPTLLLYAHHDVQPPGRAERWRSPPFAPEVRDGRLYGRGAADDKGGILCHAAAAAAWNAACGRPPINLVALIEGEEEIGSPHLAALLAAQRRELAADAALVMDAGNLAAGLPCITASLRGLVVAEAELAALRAPLHSGIWGGAVPDAALALAQLLAQLADARGRPAAWWCPPPPPAPPPWDPPPYERARFAALAGLLEAEAAPADAAALAEALWGAPALTITTLAAGDPSGTNAVAEAARARLALRVAPGQDAAALAAALGRALADRAPPGTRCACQVRECVPPWRGDLRHPVFRAVRAALALGYGRPPLAIGCGATVPLVPALQALDAAMPLILLGVEDPGCAAHAENEGLLLSDAWSALASEIALFGLLAEGGEGLAGEVEAAGDEQRPAQGGEGGAHGREPGPAPG